MKIAHVILAAVGGVLLSAALLWFFLSPGAAGDSPGARAAGAAALERAHAPMAGRPDAKVHIVEFLDPACETCRQFYPLVKKLIAENPDRVRLSVRMVAFHRNADFAVKALEASKKQGKFWPTLERVLATQNAWVVQHVVDRDAMWEQLRPLGLDLDRLRTDMESPEVARAIAQDAQDAKALKVVQTPEYFVNGRGLPEFGWAPLQRLVADEIAKTYR